MHPADIGPPRFLSYPLLWWEENSRFWLRLLIIGGALLGSALLAPWASSLHVAVVVAGAVLFALLRWPPLGLVLLAGGSLAVPVTIGTGTETSINVAVLMVAALTVLWVIEMMLGRHELRLVPSPANMPLLAFGAVALLAFGAGAQPWVSFAQTASVPAQAGGLAIYLLSFLAFLLAANQARDVRWLQAMTWGFLGVGAVLVAATLVPGGDVVLRAMLGSAKLGSVFWIWLVALAFSQAAFNRNLGALPRLALGGLVIAAFYFLLGPTKDWSSGWGPSMIVVAMVLVARAPRLIPVGLFGATVVGVALAPKLLEFAMGGDNEYSLFTRLEAWRIMGEIISINPILGVGFANYYWYTPLYPILGYAVSFNSHNNYVDILAQTGVLGMICFLWFGWALGRYVWRIRLAARPGFEQAYVYGAFGGLTAMLACGTLGDWVLPFVYNIGYSGFRSSVLGWLFLGGIVALGQIIALDRSAKGTSDVDS